jgi:serine/threonine protein kinase
MAPEQFDQAHDIGPQADVYSLGRVLQHMLTGKVPFPNPKMDHVPATFRYLVGHATEEEPENRYASVAEFSRELALVTGLATTLAQPAEAGKQMLADIVSDTDPDTGPLLKLILEYSEDEVFYHEFVARLPAHILAAFENENHQGFVNLVRRFNEYSDGGHPFSHVDTIADFFSNVISVTTDLNLRRLAFFRIIKIGFSHNRYYVQGVVCRLVTRMTDPQDVLLIADVLRTCRVEATFYRNGLEGLSLPRQIREALNTAS